MRTSEREQREVTIWRARLERAKDRRKSNLKDWDQNLKFYTNGRGEDSHVGQYDHEVVINKVFSSLRAQLPSLIFQRPKFELRARRPVIRPDGFGAEVDVSTE